MTNVGIVGAAGKMGKTLIQAITESNELNLTAAIEQEGSPAVGVDSGEFAGIGKNGVEITTDQNTAPIIDKNAKTL